MLKPETEEKLETLLTNLNTDSNRFLSLQKVATIVGIIVGVVGLLQAKDKSKELEKVENRLAQSQSTLITNEFLVSHSEYLLEQKELMINLLKDEVQDLRDELKLIRPELKQAKTDLGAALSQKDVFDSEARTLRTLNISTQDNLDFARRSLEKTQISYGELLTKLETKEREVDSKVSEIRELQKAVGVYSELVNIDDTRYLTTSAVRQLVSLRVIEVEREWYRFLSPKEFILFLDYPNEFKSHLKNQIMSVSFSTDIKLTDGKIEPQLKFDKYGNHWLSSYIGRTAPQQFSASLTILIDDKGNTVEEQIFFSPKLN